MLAVGCSFFRRAVCHLARVFGLDGGFWKNRLLLPTSVQHTDTPTITIKSTVIFFSFPLLSPAVLFQAVLFRVVFFGSVIVGNTGVVRAWSIVLSS